MRELCEHARLAQLREANGISATPRYTNPKRITVHISSPQLAQYTALIEELDRLMTVMDALWLTGVLTNKQRADGAYHRHWGLYSGGTFEPATEESAREGRTAVRMLERYPPEVNHEGWPKVVRSLAANGGFEVSDIDFIIFTQVRKPSIELVMADLGLPMEKTHTVMEKWGYTGSACVPIALDDAMEQGRISSGDLVAMVGSGVGYNQAGAAFRMP